MAITLGRLESSIHVFLADESFHGGVGLVNVDRHRGFLSLWVVYLVAGEIPNLAHIINLLVRPAVHSQGLDLADMSAQFAMNRSTPHAKKDS